MSDDLAIGSVEMRYDGLHASEHRIDMRRFGYALVGFDHVITYGVVAVFERRLAKPRERIEFDVVVGNPIRGSVSAIGGLMSAYQGLQGNLPFLVEVVKAKAPDLLWHWVSFAFKRLGGREKEADSHLSKIIELANKIHADVIEDRQHEREFFYRVVDRLAPHAASVAVPVGDAASTVEFKRPLGKETTVISIPEAAAIRSKEPLEVGDEQVVQLRIDGITKHTNRGSIEFPDNPGRFYPAEIRDPLFDRSPNPYITALSSSELLKVRVVPSFRAGELFKVYIMGLPLAA